ncbi:MAG: hypothetical protein KGI98_12050 [Euryarchaeota archaeon]|nr:hypothetical protein [Euryarchaeota archaeon]MDE1881202.1 hypothetical protein [Euryarchaeota archaeon]
MRYRFLFAAVAAAFVVSQVAAVQLAAATAPEVGWSVEFPRDHVYSGDGAEVTVIGPPNTPFLLTVTEPPWNSSQPVFQTTGVTPNATNSTATSANITVPTAPLPMAEYQVDVYLRGTDVASSHFWITPAINETSLNGTVGAIYGQLIVDQEILLGDRQQIAALSNQEQLQWDGFAIWSALDAFMLFVVWGRSSKQGAARDFHDWMGRRFHRSNPNIVFPDDYPMQDLLTPPPDSILYTSRYCVRCKATLWTRDAIHEHLMAAHSDQMGPGGPELGVNYFEDQGTKEDVRRWAEPPKSSFTREETRARDDRLGIDLDEVLG